MKRDAPDLFEQVKAGTKTDGAAKKETKARKDAEALAEAQKALTDEKKRASLKAVCDLRVCSCAELFAGGGSTPDVCRKRFRRCWVSDRKPIVEREQDTGGGTAPGKPKNTGDNVVTSEAAHGVLTLYPIGYRVHRDAPREEPAKQAGNMDAANSL